jgi:hypothetical protein
MKDHVQVGQQRPSDEELDRWCREMERRLNAPPGTCEEDHTPAGCAGCCAGCGPIADPGE